MDPATVDSGFFLSLPRIDNPALDLPYQRLLAWYLPGSILDELRPRLESFGNEAVSDETYNLIANAEREQPYIKTRNVWGAKDNTLVTSSGWKQLGSWGIQHGVVALGYEEKYGQYRRIVQHAFNYIYSASSATYSCPVSMSSGAARLLSHQLSGLAPDHPFHYVYERLIARKDNFISAQWMTERAGGSDVQNSETFAVHSPLPASEKTDKMSFEEGDWLVSGYKFFCSASDCNIAFILAKTKSGKLSLFLAPTKRTIRLPDGTTTSVRNGMEIKRLKSKFGTKPLPTAEIQFDNVRAWLVGSLDRGIPTVATLLNVSRTHNAITALSCWRRGMAIAKAFAKARTTLDQPLFTMPMHLRLLASMEVKFQGLLQLAFFTTSMLSFVDNGFPIEPPSNFPPLPNPGSQAESIQRTLTAVAKAVICKVGSMALQECAEALGGVGYLDEPDEPQFNLARLYRDTVVNSTWEGTTNVLSSEVVRHLLNGKNLDEFSHWFEGKVLARIENDDLRGALNSSWISLKEKLLDDRKDLAVALADGRRVIFSLAWVVSGALLAHDAQRDGDLVANDVVHRWVFEGDGTVGEFVFPEVVFAQRVTVDNKARINRDCRLVWGIDLPEDAATGYRRRLDTGEIEQTKTAAKL